MLILALLTCAAVIVPVMASRTLLTQRGTAQNLIREEGIVTVNGEMEL